MLRLRDIMTTDVVTVSPDLTIRDAMALLSTRHLSGAPVLAGKRVVGVVSLTDLAGFAAAEPAVPTERAHQTEDEWEAPTEWVEGETLVGLVTTTDIANAVADHKLESRTYVFNPKAEFDERGWP